MKDKDTQTGMSVLLKLSNLELLTFDFLRYSLFVVISDINQNGVLDTFNSDIEKSPSSSFAGAIQSEEDLIVAYKVKVVDESSKINVNDKTIGTFNALSCLSNILNLNVNIAEVISSFQENDLNNKSITPEILRKLLDTNYDYLKQFITVFGKQQDVIEVYNHSYKEGNMKSIKDLKMPGMKLVGKIPVNINIATKPVLLSILCNIEGFYLDESNIKKEGVIVAGTSAFVTNYYNGVNGIRIFLKIGDQSYSMSPYGAINVNSNYTDVNRYEIIFKPSLDGEVSFYQSPVLDDVKLVFLKTPELIYSE